MAMLSSAQTFAVVALVAAVGASCSDGGPGADSSDAPSASPAETATPGSGPTQADSGLFDGVVHGWRVAPDEVLDEEGIRDRNLTLDCEPEQVGVRTPSELDFTLSYFPADIDIGPLDGPDKWVCGGKGLSVAYAYSIQTEYGAASLRADRLITARRTTALMVPQDSVTEGRVNGSPAIFVRPTDPAGLDLASIIVIEDDTAPEFTILRISSDNGIPFAELLKVAEGVVNGAEGTSAAAVRRCQAQDLDATFTRHQEGAGGHLLRLIRIRNVSSSTCVLRGYPTGVVVSERGQPDVIAINGSWFPAHGRGPLDPGAVTSLGIQTDSGCAQTRREALHAPRYHHLKLLVRGGVIALEVPGEGLYVLCGVRVTRFMVWR